MTKKTKTVSNELKFWFPSGGPIPKIEPMKVEKKPKIEKKVPAKKPKIVSTHPVTTKVNVEVKESPFFDELIVDLTECKITPNEQRANCKYRTIAGVLYITIDGLKGIL